MGDGGRRDRIGAPAGGRLSAGGDRPSSVSGRAAVTNLLFVNSRARGGHGWQLNYIAIIFTLPERVFSSSSSLEKLRAPRAPLVWPEVARNFEKSLA